MFCCWLRACHVWSLHKGTALLNGFCLRISYLATVRMVWHSCAAALCGNWALRSALFCRTRRIRPRGRARRRTSFAVGRWWCRRYQCCGRVMLPICRAAIHAGSAGRLHRAAGLLG